MNEQQQIIELAQAVKKKGGKAALATLIRVVGSHYRRVGARMLITEGGQVAGSVSGGCLETDLMARAAEVIASGKVTIVTYDSTGSDDAVFGTGTGCGGKVDVMLERYPSESMIDVLDILNVPDLSPDLLCMATITGSNNIDGVSRGDRMTILTGDQIISDFAITDLQNMIAADAGSLSQHKPHQHFIYALSGGTVDCFLELPMQTINLAVFGAGDDAMPVVAMAAQMGWEVTVVDHRPTHLTEERFPGATRLISASPPEVSKKICYSDFTASVLITHNYFADMDILGQLLPSHVKYIGLLGNAERTAKMITALQSAGGNIPVDQLSRLYSPAGLDIGADGPVQIALSILAEIQTVISGAGGGFLRNSKGEDYAQSRGQKTKPGEK